MGSMFEITDAARASWQRRNYAVLGKILELGRELPPVEWSLGVHGLGADVIHGPQNQRETTFEMWRQLLGLGMWPVHEPDAGGARRLIASTKDWAGHQVGISLRTTVFPDDQDDE